MTFNTQRQQYEFVDRPHAEANATFLIYHENHNKCYYLANASELRSGSLTTFLFGARFVLCKDRHYHMSSSRLPNADTDSLHISHAGANRGPLLSNGSAGNEMTGEL